MDQDECARLYREVWGHLTKTIGALRFIGPATGPWRQVHWVQSFDGCVRVSSHAGKPAYRFWAKVVQDRECGFDGESFHAHIVFRKRSAKRLAAEAMRQWEAQIQQWSAP